MSLRQRQPRIKDARHLDFIRSLPCCICGDDTTTEAAHIRAASIENGKLYTGKGEKSSDKWTLPLCGKHHREQHAMKEMDFWKCHGINPFVLAMTLKATR